MIVGRLFMLLAVGMTLLLGAQPCDAQDMPLTQVLIEGEDWQSAAGPR